MRTARLNAKGGAHLAQGGDLRGLLFRVGVHGVDHGAGGGAVMNWAVFAMGRGVCDGGGGGRRTGKEGKESCGS